MERREETKENTEESPASRTPSREIATGGLDRVRQAARGNKKERFTALLHHVTVDLLWQAYHWLKRSAAPGR
jgi:RNA-directed DNA polymerase